MNKRKRKHVYFLNWDTPAKKLQHNPLGQLWAAVASSGSVFTCLFQTTERIQVLNSRVKSVPPVLWVSFDNCTALIKRFVSRFPAASDSPIYNSTDSHTGGWPLGAVRGSVTCQKDTRRQGVTRLPCDPCSARLYQLTTNSTEPTHSHWHAIFFFYFKCWMSVSVVGTLTFSSAPQW